MLQIEPERSPPTEPIRLAGFELYVGFTRAMVSMRTLATEGSVALGADGQLATPRCPRRTVRGPGPNSCS